MIEISDFGKFENKEVKLFTIINPHQDMPPNTLLLLWVCVLKSHSRTLYN